jgi:hypothetical protein
VKHEKCFPRPHYKIKKIMATEKAPQEQASWHSTWNTRFWCFYHIQIDPGKKPRFGLKNKALIMERTLLWMNKVHVKTPIHDPRTEDRTEQSTNPQLNNKQKTDQALMGPAPSNVSTCSHLVNNTFR